jgi:NAD(P)-dependent dehydrogenase (short-subunit alcohol dehydrogenase family)
MDLELDGKIAVVTGGSRGVGLAVTRTLVAEGARVVVGARKIGALAGLDGVTALEVDLARPGEPERLVAHAIEQCGQVDVLVNNVGGLVPRLDGFLAISDAEFEAAMQLNFFSALRAIRAVLPGMVGRGRGAIVNVASISSVLPDGLVLDYGASKAALVNVAKAISNELGPSGVRINSVSPGAVATDLWLADDGIAATVSDVTGDSADSVLGQAAAAIATGRFTTPEEVATLVALLASERTANVNGANYIIDGGTVRTT